MSTTTMLNLVKQATGEMGLSVPTTVVGNTNADVVQLLRLINGLGGELVREHQWQGLTIEYRFTTSFKSYTGDVTKDSTSITNMSSIVGITSDSTWQVTGTGINQDTYVTNAAGTTLTISQAATATNTTVALTISQTKYALPSDYDRLIDGTQWDKSKRWQMIGPETMQQKEWLKSGYISTGPSIRYYLMGDKFQIWPPLSTAEYLGFDYVSTQWVTATGGASPSKTAFDTDTDTCIFPDRLIVQGLKLKYFEIKGFETTALYRDYMTQKDIAKAVDAGSPILSMAPTPTQVLISWQNIPDSGYGS